MPRYAGRCLLAVRAGAPCARSPSFPGVHRAPAPLSAAAVAVRFRTSSVLAYPCLAMPIVVLLLAGAACGLLGPYKLYMQRPINIQVPICSCAASWLPLFMIFSLLILPTPSSSGSLLGPRLDLLVLLWFEVVCFCDLLGGQVPLPTAELLSSRPCFVSRMSIVQLSFSRLLEEICQRLGFRVPDCVATEDSARVAIQRMKSELDLHIKDINYDDCIMYKSMYDNVMIRSTNLLGQLGELKREHSVLRDCYASSIAEKVRYIDENLKLSRMAAEQRATIEHLHASRSPMATDPSESSSGS
uniref:Uncharacterized protein n=1 Tax=Ananas comosus var. bracteatus TaxID=296719 RepID=A0A6V7PPC3_ANACO|nr:unnamed protein product [Ananas comosus var. bracteatus]